MTIMQKIGIFAAWVLSVAGVTVAAQTMTNGMGPVSPWNPNYLVNPTIIQPVLTPDTWANAPAATNGKIYVCSNCATKPLPLVSDGTRWRPFGVAPLATLDAPTNSIANSETIVLQFLSPINMIRTGDRIRTTYTLTKSGTTDIGTIKVRVGTTGTTADTAVITSSGLVAANRTIGWTMDMRLNSATSMYQDGNSSNSGATSGYTGGGASAPAGAVTISSMATNPIFITLTAASSSTNDTVVMLDSMFEWIASAN